MDRVLLLLVVAACVGRTLAVAGPGTGVLLPVFPDNIVAFPNRDFIHLDGFFAIANDVDPKLRVEVYQGPGPTFKDIIGAAVGIASGSAAGALEINHPGALCWGAGLADGDPLKSVTPDFVIGDKIVVKHGGDIVASMIVADARGTVKHSDATNTDDVSVVWSVKETVLTITGSVAEDVDLTGAEVRVVAPDLRDRFPGLRRDVRVTTAGPAKLPGLIQAGSQLTFGPLVDGRRSWKATFEFDGGATIGVANAKLAYETGDPAITFGAVTDASGNMQGITITEFLQSGGPGVGTCPPGPTTSAPKAGTYSTVPTATPGELKVLWTLPAAGTAQQAARTGFSVTARSKAPAIGVKYTEVGQYVADPEATSTVLMLPGASPDAADWEVRVRSEVTGQQLSTPFPFAAAGGSTTTGTSAPATCSNPQVTEAVSGGKVVLKAVPNVPIYYTTNNVSALENTAYLADAASIYDTAKGIAIPAGGLTLSWVAFGAGSGSCTNSSEPHPVAAPTTPQVTEPPIVSTLSAGQQLKILTAWSSNDPAAVDYVVKIWKGAAPPATADTAADDSGTTTTKSLAFTGLKAGDKYWFRVAGRNADKDVGPWSDFNADALIVQDVADTIVVTQNKYLAAKDWRIAGTSTSLPDAASINICKVNYCEEADSVAVVSGVGLIAAAAPGGLATWSVRLRNGNAGNEAVGFKTYISSSLGGRITSVTAA